MIPRTRDECHPLVMFLGLQIEIAGFLDDAREAMVIGDRERTLAALRNAEAIVTEHPSYFRDG